VSKANIWLRADRGGDVVDIVSVDEEWEWGEGADTRFGNLHYL
jgi:hypothetical protein